MNRDHWTALAWFFGGAVVVLAVTYCLPGCTALKQEAAETTYSGQQLECVSGAHSLMESKKCRAEVDARWGRDGGADGN